MITFLYRSYISYPDELADQATMRIQNIPYKVISETKCGWWIEYPNAKGKKFVLDGPGKRFAHPTVEESVHALIKRKQAHMRHVIRQYEELSHFLNRTHMATFLFDEDAPIGIFNGWTKTIIVDNPDAPKLFRTSALRYPLHLLKGKEQ
jgi:hypothetical protein